ncbi:MAG: YeeE/YedE family protein [Alphaproteobacteria bacterium]|nr:MAG: YeeE/YedE family protein [Alphaproteobacteria bacterium]
MDLAAFFDAVGEPAALAMIGLAAGVIFGVAAQRSAFCLRAATVEFARGQPAARFAVWLLCFSTALVWVQGAVLAGAFDPGSARMMSITGSWSGAVIGGLMFGAGMILARGCSGRLLVLAATGNLRSVVSGLIFAVSAQMSLRGVLSPYRNALAELWTTSGGGNVDLLAAAGAGPAAGLAIGLGLAALALWLSWRHRIGVGRLFMGSGVGFAVAVGWVLTWQAAQVSFTPVTVESMSFTGPSARTLMFLLDEGATPGFEIGMIAGVFLGSAAAAFASGEFRLQGFDGAISMRRAMLGAALMGFGGMLAGGCAIGAGVSGGSIFVGTAWLALVMMWVGAVATDWLVDQGRFPALLSPGQWR